MPINAACPECQNQFRLRDDMVGKSTRCPVCQEVFVVQSIGAASPTSPQTSEKPPASAGGPRTRTDPPAANYRSGNVTDFVPLVDTSAIPKPAPPNPKPQPRPVETHRPSKVLPPPTAADFPWDEAPRPKTKTGPKEITWSPDLAVPSSPPPKPVEEEIVYEEVIEEIEYVYEDEPSPSPSVIKAKKKNRGRIIVGLMTAFILLMVGGGGYFWWRYASLEPDRIRDAARADYEVRNFLQAKAQFDKLLAEYPKHKHAPEARFFSELSGLRQSIGSVMNRGDPSIATNQWTKFLEDLSDPEIAPFAAKDRFGIDLWDAGGKLFEDVLGKATDSFDKENPDEAEKWLGEAGKIDASLERFKPDGAERPARFAGDMAALRDKIASARERLAKIAQVEAEMDDEKARQLAIALGLQSDDRVKANLREKEQKIQAKAVYKREPQPLPAIKVPDDGLTSLLFAPSFGAADRRDPSPQPTTFFCLARGVLYALDENNAGRVLWATRTGLDSDVMPLHVRPSSRDAFPEMVLLITNAGPQFGLAARGTRDGRPLWYQPLPTSARGVPVVIGANVYVSLGDPTGTILEISLATGEVIGKITLGRPVGPQIAVRPGTGFLYIPADAQATYVFDCEARDPNGQRLDPTLLGVIDTAHAPGSLRGTPVFSNPGIEDPGPKFLILGQAEGLDSMKLRAYPIAADGKPTGGETAEEIAIGGWASFPPHCDGEKMAVVTDKGEFGLYGLALAGNRDVAIFAFPSRTNATSGRPSRGQVVLSSEGEFWVLVSGELRRMRFGLSTEDGVRLAQTGAPIPAGEPLHAPQFTPDKSLFVVVTQDGTTCRATAVEARTGLVRWRRDLGLIAKGDPIRVGNSVVLLDQAGAFYRIETAKLLERGPAAWLLDERWLVHGPAATGFTPVTGLIAGPGETALAILANDAERGTTLAIRKYSNVAVEEKLLPNLAPLAGRPIVSGQFLILPLADGTLYRWSIADGKGEAGPSWRGDRQPATATCYLTPINADELFASDGGRTIVRWRWESTSKLFETRGKLVMPDRVAATPAVLSGNRLVVGDVKGSILMWDGDKMAPPALKAWRPETIPGLPIGAIADGLQAMVDGDKQRLTYTVNGRLVMLSPAKDTYQWVGPEPIKAIEGRPVWDVSRITLTDRAGVVRSLDASTGKPTGEEFHLSGSHAFAAAAVPLGNGKLLIPLADGTVVLGELVKK